MAAPLSETEREAILDDIRAGQLSRNAIATKHGRSAGTVTRLAQHLVGDDAFDRSSTEDATRARKVDMRARRAEIAARMLDEATACLDQLHGSFRVFSFGGKENTYNEHLLPGPPTGDIRNLMTSAAVAIDKHVVLDRHDAHTDDDQAGEVLGKLFDGLDAAYRAIKGGSVDADGG